MLVVCLIQGLIIVSKLILLLLLKKIIIASLQCRILVLDWRSINLVWWRISANSHPLSRPGNRSKWANWITIHLLLLKQASSAGKHVGSGSGVRRCLLWWSIIRSPLTYGASLHGGSLLQQSINVPRCKTMRSLRRRRLRWYELVS